MGGEGGSQTGSVTKKEKHKSTTGIGASLPRTSLIKGRATTITTTTGQRKCYLLYNTSNLRDSK